MEAAHGQDHEGADKLVARVRKQVENGMITLDVEKVSSKFDDAEFNEHDGKCSRRRVSKHLWMESAAKAVNERRRDDVRDKRHEGYIHVGAVDILTWRAVGHGFRGAHAAITCHGGGSIWRAHAGVDG